MEEREHNVPHFLDLIRRSRRGKFKVYIGMIAGVGKTYRMLQEAHLISLPSGFERIRGFYKYQHQIKFAGLLKYGYPGRADWLNLMNYPKILK